MQDIKTVNQKQEKIKKTYQPGPIASIDQKLNSSYYLKANNIIASHLNKVIHTVAADQVALNNKAAGTLEYCIKLSNTIGFLRTDL